MKTWQAILYGAFLALIAVAIVLLIARKPHGNPIELQPIPTREPLMVYVSGAVQTPGLYSLPQGSRVADALNLAGGLRSDADQSVLNLAARLKDEERIYIAKIGESVRTPGPERASNTTDISNQSPYTAENPLNLNTATLDNLQLLPGIGPTKAQAILDYRNKNGKFTEIDDLLDVPGIGPTIFDTLKPLVSIE